MAARFCIYSTDANPVTDPDSAITKIDLDTGPILRGEIDLLGDAHGRGSTHRTLGGLVVQDFGVTIKDRTIRVAASDCLSEAKVSQLEALYVVRDAEYLFGTGFETYRVKFSRNPAGFRSWRNMQFSHHGKHFFSYELNFIVVAKES
jgi:hypothetical protein